MAIYYKLSKKTADSAVVSFDPMPSFCECTYVLRVILSEYFE